MWTVSGSTEESPGCAGLVELSHQDLGETIELSVYIRLMPGHSGYHTTSRQTDLQDKPCHLMLSHRPTRHGRRDDVQNQGEDKRQQIELLLTGRQIKLVREIPRWIHRVLPGGYVSHSYTTA